VLEARCLPSTVSNLNDAGPGSLRDAIALTPSGGTVDFQAGLTGTILLTSGELAITNDVTIAGPGADLLTVSGNHASGAFNIEGAFTVAISGMTIADGLVATGFDGGIVNSGTLTVTNSILSGNFPRAIFNSGTLTLTNSTLSGNGLGISNFGTLTLTNSTLSGSSASGIFNDGMLTVTNSTLSGNSAGIGVSTGGAILNANPGTVNLTNCTLSGNSAFGGGAINNEGGGTVTITSSTLSGNSAIGAATGVEGGGGAIDNGGTVTITNSTLSGNSAGGLGGGAIYSFGTLTITNSTLSGNSAFGGGFLGGAAGGGIRGTVTHSRNTIIAGNTAPTAPDLAGDLGSQGYNLIGNSQGGSGFDPSDLLDVDPLLGPLQDNGGPTQTMALMVGSPALTAGDPAQLGVADQRGVVRSGGVNSGAYQASASALVLTAPDTVTAGAPFSITVQAVDPFEQTAVGYQGMVHFVASNGAMADYAFTAADGGQHTFDGLVLRRAQTLTVTGTDTGNDSITGTTAFTITPAAADHLLFLQQPTDTAAGQTISPAVMVAVVDAYGNVETGDNTDTITLSIGTNPGGGTLSGTLTLTVLNGVATFTDLSIDQAGMGYTLHATVGGGLPDSDSDAFTITGG
jgi:hypothetical protein